MNHDTIRALAEQLLQFDDKTLTAHERRVIERAARRLAVSRDVNLEYESGVTFGQRLADRVAEIGGSWAFLIGFGAFVFAWTSVNSWLFVARAFDPYPYIFLNLMLSMLAAIQAPVILMSQNRQAARDRLVVAHDYEVNLKAEIEIAALHDKLDQIRAQDLAALAERFEKAMAAKQ